jgi:hypothetical protein
MSRKTDPVASIFAIFFVILMIIVIVIVLWIIENWIIVLSGIIIIGAILGVYYLLKFQKEKQDSEEKIKISVERRRLWDDPEQNKLAGEQNEKELIEFFDRSNFQDPEQKEEELISFSDRYNVPTLGTLEEIEKLKKGDDEDKIKDILINRIVQSIQKFQPARKWPDEDSYHKELLGYLSAEYPDIKYEFQIGSSRPDLVIGNIAIEIKGPTDDDALNTLTTKCLKYSHHFDHLIMILFDPYFSERHFKEVEDGIHRWFPHVVIIRK